MRLTRCHLRLCRCLLHGASVKILEPCTLMRHSGVTLLFGYILCCFWLVLLFRLQYVLPWQKVRQMRIEQTTLRLWDLRAADCAIVAVSVMVHQWSFWNLVHKCGIPKWLLSSFFVLLLVSSSFSSPACITVTKSATSEDRTHDLKIMRLTRCRLRHCRCLRFGASVKVSEPCTLMRHSGITLLSSYRLCCFCLALVFPLLHVLQWQKVRQVRIELTTLRLWDLHAATCAIVAVFITIHMPQRTSKILPVRRTANGNALFQNNNAFSLAVNRTSKILLVRCGICIVMFFMVHQWNLVHKCGIPKWLLSSFFVLLLVGSSFSSPACITVTKSAASEDRTHDLKIMRLTRCRLRHCRCLRYGTSVKLLEPCT